MAKYAAPVGNQTCKSDYRILAEHKSPDVGMVSPQLGQDTHFQHQISVTKPNVCLVAHNYIDADGPI